MALSKERKGEIALIILNFKLEEEGIRLKPNETRRSIVNMAKKLGISETELAEFMKESLTTIFNKTIEKVDHFIK